MRWSFVFMTVFLASPRFARAQQASDDPDSELRTRQVQLWDRMKQALQAPNGLEYFRTSMQGATIPGSAGGLHALRGTVISREPPDRPTVLTLSMSDNGIADVTLRLVDEPTTPDREEAPASVPPKPVAREIRRNDIGVDDLIREWREQGLHTGWVSGPRKQMLTPQQKPVIRTGEPAPGASVEFEGIAHEFSPAPFMLTFEVSMSKIRIVEAKK